MAKKHTPTHYLNWVGGWLEYEEYPRIGSIARADVVVRDGIELGWRVTDTASEKENWRFEAAKFMHGETPSSKVQPPRPLPNKFKQYLTAEGKEEKVEEEPKISD